MKASEWIDERKQKPPFGIPVLVHCKIYGIFIATFEQILGSGWGNWRHNDELGILPPTHWMPLPEPPAKN